MSVAIPVRDGGTLFAVVLDALAKQSVEHELVVCDSGSTDGSLQLARERATRVLEIGPERFSHGGTRNLLMQAAKGAHVALLTQDAQPAGEHWLERLLAGFELADDVGIVYGPYRPRADAPVPVRLELERWFASLSLDGAPALERLSPHERALPVRELVGRRGFFTDANACVSREAWQRTPFREVAYAEDRVLAIDMLRAGYAKAYVPDAAVLHSHHYSVREQLRRGFDEGRALLEIYGWRESAAPAHQLLQLRGELSHARRELSARGAPPAERRATFAALVRHHLAARTGALLGSHADRLPAAARRGLSLDGRGGFAPLGLDDERPPATDHEMRDER